MKNAGCNEKCHGPHWKISSLRKVEVSAMSLRLTACNGHRILCRNIAMNYMAVTPRKTRHSGSADQMRTRNPDPEDFQNLMRASLSRSAFIIKFS